METDFVSAINERNARRLLRLFHECYKHGVEDASRVYDEEKRKVYVGAMETSHTYMKVGQDYEIKWKEWIVELLMYCRNMNRMDVNIVRDYLYDIKEYKGYKAIPLRVSMDFYVRGVKAFNDYPAYQGMELFLAENKAYRWQKGFYQTIPLSYIDFFEDMHMMVYDRMHTDMEMISNKDKGYGMAFKHKDYDTFLMIMNVATAPDRTKVKKKN